MLNWLKRIWCFAQPAASADARNADAKKFLEELRENELSVGAAFRRGETVKTAPGQATAGDACKVMNAGRVVRQGPQNSRSAQPDAGGEADTEDFPKSMVIGAATGSAMAMAGYAASGSLSGGLIGSALDNSADTSTTLDN